MLTIEAALLAECPRPAPDTLSLGRPPRWLLPLAGAMAVHGCLLILLLAVFERPSHPLPQSEVVEVALSADIALMGEAAPVPSAARAAPLRPPPVPRQTRNRKPIAPPVAATLPAAIAGPEVSAAPPATPQASASPKVESRSSLLEKVGGTAAGDGVGPAETGSSGPEAALVQARPRYRDNPPPPYPEAARRRQLEGTVVLEVLVSAEGKVGELMIHGSSGHRLLDEIALQAVRSWLFEPGRRGDVPVTMKVLIPVRFGLR